MENKATNSVEKDTYTIGALTKTGWNKKDKKPKKVYNPGDEVQLTAKQAQALNANGARLTLKKSKK